MFRVDFTFARSARVSFHVNVIKVMFLKFLASFSGLFILAYLTGCADIETVPRVAVSDNDSGIEIRGIRESGPSCLIGGGLDMNGKALPPDLPSRAIIGVKRVEPLHNKEPRYFIPASGTVQVVSVERYSDYGGFSVLKKWRDLLNEEDVPGADTQRMLFKDQIPEIPWMNAGRCFHAKLRKKRFPWGDAVLFLTTYVQGNTGGPVNNDMLVLVAQGLTNDGKYAVNAHFEIHHPSLPDSAWDERRSGKAVFSIDDENEEAERWLDSQSDDSFAPSIGQYEVFLSSLVISEGSPAKTNFREKPHQESVTPPN